jgi:endonuclease-3
MAERLPAKKARARKILARLARAYPHARTELHFTTPLDLLVATILSAQCTDERVNAVTAELFTRYRTARDWAGIPLLTLEREIHSTGFFRNKTKSILGMARALLERHGGVVPRTMEELTALPGVGRKTANVILGNAFGIPGVVVDTHVTRVAARLGLTRQKDADKIEADLAALFPERSWTELSHLLIHHGRRVCDARAPRCPECVLLDLCPEGARRTKAPPAAKRAAKPAASRRGRAGSGRRGA